jgi:hypothetical protein
MERPCRRRPRQRVRRPGVQVIYGRTRRTRKVRVRHKPTHLAPRMRVAVLAALCVAAMTALFAPSASALTCSAALQQPGTFTGVCTQDWQSLKPLMRPTQMQVGYAWVRYKLDTDFDTQSDAQAQISSKTIPTVIGPDGGLYIVDDHHNLAALDYSGFSSVVVSVQVMCDKRNENVKSFWADLVQNNLVYLGFYPAGQQTSTPTTIRPTSLANRFVRMNCFMA